MPPARVTGLDLASVLEGPEPGSGEAEVLVSLEDGRTSRFLAATPDRAGRWMAESGLESVFRPPVLYVARFDDAAVADAVQTMAAELGGYWLRYYNSKTPPPPKPAELASASVRDPEGPPECGCAVFEAMLRDARQFSLLAATPEWFGAAMARLGLRCYFGAQVLFVRRADEATARSAARRMAEAGERWLCLYDAPRTTLPKVLEAFKAKHP